MSTRQSISKQLKVVILSLTLILVAIIVYILIRISSTELISANKFNEIIENNKIEKIFIKDDYVVVDSNNGKYKSLKSGVNLDKIYKNYPVARYKSSSKSLTFIAVFLLLLILITLILLVNKRVPKQDVIEVKDRELDVDPITPQAILNSSINFKSLAGIEHAVDDLKELVDFIKYPKKYQELKIKMPKGVLLIGPPGVGKTMIAKAIANEANVPFFYKSGASFVQIYAGMGAKRVKELFNEAKELAPAIVFIDEIDALGKSRELLNSDERESTLNQLLVEMDGFEESENILVVGATNRVEILDSALLRPGRFDRHIHIDLPNLQDREKIVKLYLKSKRYSFDIVEVAKATAGFSPASLEILINEASLHAFRDNRDSITVEDIESVKDRVKYGKKKIQLLSKKEREIRAYAQASKSVVAYWLGYKFDKVSILNSLSFDNLGSIFSKKSLEDEIKIHLSSKVYLEKKFNDTFSITKEDVKYVKELMVKINELDIEDYISDTQSYTDELEASLNSLDNAIEQVAKVILEKEYIDYRELKAVIDDIF